MFQCLPLKTCGRKQTNQTPVPRTVIQGNQWLWSDVWVPVMSANSELKEVDEVDTNSQDSDTVRTNGCGVMSGYQ